MDRAEAEGLPVRRLEAFARELKGEPKKKTTPTKNLSDAPGPPAFTAVPEEANVCADPPRPMLLA